MVMGKWRRGRRYRRMKTGTVCSVLDTVEKAGVKTSDLQFK
jgi:hypothetical protein